MRRRIDRIVELVRVEGARFLAYARCEALIIFNRERSSNGGVLLPLP
jgi:hypothetical protein